VEKGFPMSLIQKRYEVKRQIEQLSERLKEIDAELLAEAELGEVLDIGNGGYYRVGVTTKTTYPPEVIIDLAKDLPLEALPQVVKLSKDILKRLVKQKLVSKKYAEAYDAMATVTTTKTLGQLKRFEDDVMEAIESE